MKPLNKVLSLMYLEINLRFFISVNIWDKNNFVYPSAVFIVILYQIEKIGKIITCIFLIQLLDKKLYIINILVYGKLQLQSIMLDYFKIKK